jgi:hypothetical protein
MTLYASMKRPLLSALGVLAMIQASHGVVVISGDTNNTAPGGQPYFDNVGSIGGASGIYLGNRWVVTAAHVAGSLPASATFGGTTYATEAGTFHRINNPTGSGLSTLTDIVLFRLGTDPGLPSLSIASGTPTVGDAVTMIGDGRVQEASPTYWQVTSVTGPNNDVWAELAYPDPNINAAGFKTTATREVRWGKNNIDSVNETISYGAGDVRAFITTFNNGALPQEAQAVSGDSGGAVLFQVGSDWVLTGMMVAVGTFDNQPSGAASAVLGDITASADLTYYRDQILQIIPEPSIPSLFLIGSIGLISLRRR